MTSHCTGTSFLYSSPTVTVMVYTLALSTDTLDRDTLSG